MPLGMLGKYERLDVLGHGASGIVYLAKDTLLNKQVALKEVDVQAGDVRRFLEEARVMDRLRHPNIVRVNGVDRIEGKIVIDMEYVRGQNLQDLLRAEGCLSLDRALDIAVQVLDALDYAHRMQTVHRDIKPANILIGRDGTVKLVDFGLAEILATNAYAGGAGTYAYMAPEDFAEEDRSDSQSDIWAVGVTLYEMLTAQRPFQVARVKDPFAWKRVLETEAPTPITAYLPAAPPGLQAILDRALTRSKPDRYPTAGEFRDDLRRLHDALTPLLKTLSLSGEAVVRPLAPGPMNGNGAHKEAQTAEATPPQETETALRTGPGVVVAEVSPTAPPQEEAEKKTKRGRLPFGGRKQVEILIEPESVDFGALRKGEARTVKVQARVSGLEGRVSGRVLHNPGWLTVHPTAFDRPRQTLTLTAYSDRAWETGEFEERVRVETNAGAREIPVRLTVLKPRPTFWRIALWYVPLFASVLMPALAVAFGTGSHAASAEAAALVPPASVASGLLAVMLLLIGVGADIGLSERIACGVLTLVMGTVLGISMRIYPTGAAHDLMMHRIFVTGGIIGALLVLQLLYLRRWKFWAFVLAGLGVLIGSTLLRVLMV